jgi:response regulator RpfG family c-di-GMP phosphodiesterase
MSDVILIIDDDANLLAAMRRQLRDRFTIRTAQGGEEAVALLATGKELPAVVLCDMRMGGMDGIKTLGKVQELAPDAVRLMLTGNADMQTAIDAINTGNIFRFLTKPCAPAILEAGLTAALEQHRLITAERELLEQTLAGSVKVLSDLLALTFAEGYGRTARVYGWVQKLTANGAIPHRWQLNLAAMLAPLGMVALPREILTRMHRGSAMTEAEHSQIEQTPAIARNLIANIPRLKGVADIVYLQHKGFDGSGFPADGPAGLEIPFDARVLKILNDLGGVCTGVAPTLEDFAVLERRSTLYDMTLLYKVRACLAGAGGAAREVRRILPTARLLPGMHLAEDVVSKIGQLVLAGQTPLAEAHIERLRQLAQYQYIVDAVSVVSGQEPVPKQ